MSTRVAALLTSFNRCEQTVKALASLFGQSAEGVHVQAYLVDAGSTDGTARAVAESFPSVRVIPVGPDVFWNAGMRRAFGAALADGGHTHFLLLNDDTQLDGGALGTLIATERDLVRGRGPCIVVGAVRDPDDGTLTYGGVERRSRLRPLNFTLVQPQGAPRQVETMNANVVLVPAEVVGRIGILDEGFSHGMGDYDYGLRAGRAGIETWMAPGTVGVCARNPKDSESRSFREELTRLRGVKGLPPREWFLFARRWGGPLWPLYAVSPYVRRLAPRLLGR